MGTSVKIHERRGIQSKKVYRRKKKDKTPILDKEGSLSTSDEYEAIYLGPGSYNVGEIPYFVKVSKIRAIIYCAECLRNRKTYLARRNMLYRSGYAETTVGESRRHLPTFELDRVGRFFWNSVFGAPSASKLTLPIAVDRTRTEARLMGELLRKSTSFGRQGGTPDNNEKPANEKQN